MRYVLIGVFLCLALSASPARADVLFYGIPGTEAAFVLQGKVQVNPGRTVTLRHEQFGDLYFGLENIRFFRTEKVETLASRQLQRAANEGTVQAHLDAARWCLHRGQLDKAYEALGAAWKIDPNHADVQRLASLKRKMSAPLPVSTSLEDEMREYVKTAGEMQFVRSPHFLLLHDTSPKPDPVTKKVRATERLRLLEKVYESFLLKFALEGHELEVPKERLKVVLFSDRQDYLNFGEKEDISGAAGFYTKLHNTAVFYDQGTNDTYKLLASLNDTLQTQKEHAIRYRTPGAKDLVRFANTLQLLTRVSKENADIEVVSHEATHQMAANTGLMPNDSPVPVWAAEGLATYFECPSQASWAGIGTVNKDRLDYYRVLASRQADRSNIDFVTSDEVFMLAANGYTIQHAYGQAWALTHFLMEQRFDDLMKFYRLVAAEKSEEPLSAEKYREIFQKAFGEDTDGLNAQWQQYMRSLKTDLELVLEEE